jgi:hypothetical protein
MLRKRQEMRKKKKRKMTSKDAINSGTSPGRV